MVNTAVLVVGGKKGIDTEVVKRFEPTALPFTKSAAQMGAQDGSTPSADSEERLGCTHTLLAQVKISVFYYYFDTVQKLKISHRLDDQSQVKAIFIGAGFTSRSKTAINNITRTSETVRPE